MGDRVHIVARHQIKMIKEDGMTGFYEKTLYSPKQRDWFNNDSCQLADWLNEYTDCWLEGDESEWVVPLDDLESLTDEAFRDPVDGYTEDEMRRFVAECIRCAKLNGGECRLEWY